MKEIEKISTLKEMIALSKADGEIDFNEAIFIAKVAESIGIVGEELEQIYLNLEAIEFVPPASEMERLVQFKRLVMVVCSDEVILPEEISFLKRQALRLGLNPIAVDRYLHELSNSDYVNGQFPDLISFFKIYHN